MLAHVIVEHLTKIYQPYKTWTILLAPLLALNLKNLLFQTKENSQNQHKN